jgi:hypothetical protein
LKEEFHDESRPASLFRMKKASMKREVIQV